MARLSRAESMAVTRSKLIEAALKVFMRDGYAGATIEEIVEAAGFSRGAFYAHFSGKQEILLAGLTSEIETIGRSLIGKIQTCSSAQEVIEAVSEWADARSHSKDEASLMLELMQQADGSGASNTRFARLFETSWSGVGETLRPFFPDQTLPGTPSEIVAIIASLTYGPVVGGATEHRPGRLVHLVLSSMMLR